MTKSKKLEEGSRYELITKFLARNPGTTSSDICRNVEITPVQCSRAMNSLYNRGYVRKKVTPVKNKNGSYSIRSYWYLTADAPISQQEDFDEPNFNKYAKALLGETCFKAKTAFNYFNNKLFEGNEMETARDLAKTNISQIDRTYGTAFRIDEDVVIHLTYFPLIDTMEDKYIFKFEWFFKGENMGIITDMRMDMPSLSYSFDYANKTFVLHFKSLDKAWEKWKKKAGKLFKSYNDLVEKEYYDIGDIGAPID